MEELKKLKLSINEYIESNMLEYASSKYGLGKIEGLKLVLKYIERKLNKEPETRDSKKQLRSF